MRATWSCCAGSQEEAEAALEKLREWMAGAGLTLHPDKTRTVDMAVGDRHCDFLGYRFKRSRRGEVMRLVRPQSLRKLRESIKPRTRGASGRSMAAARETEFAILRNGAHH
jgi:hypothetical protein